MVVAPRYWREDCARVPAHDHHVGGRGVPGQSVSVRGEKALAGDVTVCTLRLRVAQTRPSLR